MDIHRGSCIVPSNAPSLHDSILDEISLPNGRVLQERCSNRQQDYLDQDLPEHRKHVLYPPTENIYGGNASSYISSQPTYGTFLDSQAEEQELGKESYHLFRMLMRSDAYNKYRSRQPKDNPKEQEQTWPDHMERAFFLALVKYPPMGRRKQMYEGKARGRNELIAFAIQKWTGESRTRKQVSSHIQVLKPLFKEYPKIMKYMSKDDSESRSHRHHHSDGGMHRRRIAGYPQMRQLDFNCVDQNIVYSSQRDDPLPPPSHVLTSSDTAAQNSSIEPAYFEMYVHDKSQGKARSLHTFTKIEDRPEHSPLRLTDASQDASLPFHLRELLGGNEPDCNVILADASIALMAHQLPKGVELGINLELTTTYDHTSVDHFESNTLFFSGNKRVNQCRGELGYSPDARRLHAKTGIFASHFWAHKFVELSGKLREANKKDNSLIPNRGQAAAADEDVRRLRDWVHDELSGLSAVQEVFAVRRPDYEGTEFTLERILIIGWTFRQAERGKAGRTSWRRVIFPSPKEEPLKQEQQFGNLALELPGNSGIIPTTQPFDQQSFDLDPLSTIGMPGLPPSVSSAAPLPDMSQEDFTGGHINIFLEPTMSMQGYYDISSQPPLDASGVATQPSYDQMQAYPRQWSNYASLDSDIYSQHMQSYAAQHSQYARESGQIKDETALAPGHYMGQDVQSGRRDSGMLGM